MDTNKFKVVSAPCSPHGLSPKKVGYYEMGGSAGIQIWLDKKPNWWHRFWMNACLDITWADKE